MDISIFGSTGFIGQNLVKGISKCYKLNQISIRDKNWKVALQNSDVFIKK